MILLQHQVPDYPEHSASWLDYLRWMVMVMDEDDDALPCITGICASVLRTRGIITDKQVVVAERVRARIYDAWLANDLKCCEPDNVPYEMPKTLKREI